MTGPASVLYLRPASSAGHLHVVVGEVQAQPGAELAQVRDAGRRAGILRGARVQGQDTPARTATIPRTTSSSTRVKARRRRQVPGVASSLRAHLEVALHLLDQRARSSLVSGLASL